MRLSYYPGCSLEGTAKDYDQSVRTVCRALDIELVEIPDWNCCGASSAHMTDHEIGMRLPLRNLRLALAAGDDILVPCAACYQRLRAAELALRADPSHWDMTDLPNYQIVHISSLLARPEILALIREKVSRPLQGLRLACYYGCLSLRHPRVTGASNWEMPENLEKIVAAVGAEVVAWSHRTECCSGSLTLPRPDIAMKLVGDIVAAARRGGASALVTDCPMCQANVETRQQSGDPATPSLPVFFATELLVAAMEGRYPLGQQRNHLVVPTPLTELFTRPCQTREERL